MELCRAYPQEHVFAHYLTLGTHDTERILTLCGRSTARLKLALLVLFAFPGAPGIYYGDEIGLEGEMDPDSRRAFPWDSTTWNGDLRSFVQRLIRTRRESLALRRGGLQVLTADDRQAIIALARSVPEDSIALLLNTSSSTRRVRLDVASLGWADGKEIVNALDGVRLAVRSGHLVVTLSPLTGALLRADRHS
jgi:glycosidase